MGQRPYFVVDPTSTGLNRHVQDQRRSNQLWHILLEQSVLLSDEPTMVCHHKDVQRQYVFLIDRSVLAVEQVTRIEDGVLVESLVLWGFHFGVLRRVRGLGSHRSLLRCLHHRDWVWSSRGRRSWAHSLSLTLTPHVIIHLVLVRDVCKRLQDSFRSVVGKAGVVNVERPDHFFSLSCQYLHSVQFSAH